MAIRASVSLPTYRNSGQVILLICQYLPFPQKSIIVDLAASRHPHLEISGKQRSTSNLSEVLSLFCLRSKRLEHTRLELRRSFAASWSFPERHPGSRLQRPGILQPEPRAIEGNSARALDSYIPWKKGDLAISLFPWSIRDSNS